MGSSGSRPSASVVDATEDSKRSTKNKQSFLVPFLRFMSCGISSSWKTNSFLQQRPTTLEDRLSYQIGAEKSGTCDGQAGSCQFQSSEDSQNREGSDEFVSDNVSTASYQSLCGSVESTDPTLSNGSSIVDNASLSFGQIHMPYHKTDRPVTSISRSERSFETHSSTAQCLPTTYISNDDLSSNQLTSEGHENNLGFSLPNISRVEGTPRCMLEQEISAHSGESGIPYVSLQHGSSTIDLTLPQDTVSSVHSDDLGGNESSGLVALALDNFSISRRELSGREARQNSGRRLWDALTRASSRRRRLSPLLVQADEAADGSRSLNDDWGLFDWNSREVTSGFPYESDLLSRRSSNTEERRRARPQVRALQHFSDSVEGSSGHPRHCAFGRHPNGLCSCEAFVMTEESSTRASISRIVMLAEALFEVLDEIHRQSVTLSRSTSISLVSLPAPEAVVDSFAVRIYKKSDPSVSVLGQCAECYICLIEFEEGDHIRVLPCCHEFHMSCVDRWLKEAHRVCPLCRHNVCEETARP